MQISLFIDKVEFQYQFCSVRDKKFLVFIPFITNNLHFCPWDAMSRAALFCVHLVCVLLVYPIPNKPLVLHVCRKNLLKTLWEKEKLLIKSNFFFSNSVFYPFGELTTIFIKLKIVVCKPF